MSLSTILSSFTRPGTKLVENQAGSRISEIASHNTIYMVGSGTLGSYLTPTLVLSLEDFENQFGTSPSENSVKALFREYSGSKLYFVRAGINDAYEITVTARTVGTLTININGTPVNISVVSADDNEDVATKILAAINTTSAVSALVTAYAGSTVNKILVKSDNPATSLTLTSTSTDITLTDVTPTVPSATDYISAIENSFDVDEAWEQGFLIAPEAFKNLALATDRLAVGNAMENLASSEGFDWVALVDNHSSIVTVSQLQTDSAQYVSPIGHLAYFAPHLIDLEGVSIPASSVVAASACKKYSKEGFQEPIGGTRYKLTSVKDVAVKYSNTEQSVLNPGGCNLVRNLRNKGVCIWGMRTRASDSDYRFIHTRVIMNVVNGTLRQAFDTFPFSSIDGEGVVLHRIDETAYSVGIRLWNGKALFGNNPEEAFQVVCNFNNNPSDQLETGAVVLQFYCAPVPGLERLLVATYRVPIGQVQLAASGEI